MAALKSKIILIIVVVFLAIIGVVGFIGFKVYQELTEIVEQIKVGDQYYAAGKYQQAADAYKKANTIRSTPQATDRLKNAQQQLLAQTKAPTLPTIADSTATPAAADSATSLPTITVTVPPALPADSLAKMVKAKKFSREGNLDVMLSNPAGVNESIAAQIFDYLYAQNQAKFADKLTTQPELRIALFDKPEKYQKPDYQKAVAYVQVDKEKLKMIWNASNTFFQIYLDQMPRYSLFSFYHTRLAIVAVALPYYDQLKAKTAGASPADSLKVKADLVARFQKFVDHIAAQLQLRTTQVYQETILQAKPEINEQ